MLVCLPLLAWLIILHVARRSGRDLRAALIISGIIWASCLVAITEVASFFHSIDRGGLAIGWLSVLVVSLIAGKFVRRAEKKPGANAPVDRWVKALAIVVGAEMAGLLVIALIAPPNTWDAMTYHMSRVMHWMQNGSVAHYPTNILRQIHLNPGAEFIILHLQVLWGGDRLANLSQWMAMAGSVIAVTLIARRCAAGPLGQTVAAAVCVSIPMGVLQSTGAQNDYVETFWLVSATWLLFEMRERQSWIFDLLFALAIGLAILTKATAFLYGLPLVIWFIVQRFGGAGPRTASAGRLLVVAVVAAAFSAGHWTRNYRTFGHVLGPDEEVVNYRNASFAPQFVVSNFVRNLSLYVNVGSENFCKVATRAVELLHSAVGLDVHDPRTTLIGTNYWIPDRWSHEDEAGSGFHLLLIVLSMVVCWVQPVEVRRSILPLIWIGLGGFFLFCLYLRFQPWNNRLHLPLIVVMCPLVGVAVEHLRRAGVGIVLGAALAAYALPYLLCNETRPIVGKASLLWISRQEALFLGRPEARVPYEVEVARLRARPCRRVGLILNPDGWEYPFWEMFNGGRAGPYFIDQVDIKNTSAGLPGGVHHDPANPNCVMRIRVEP